MTVDDPDVGEAELLEEHAGHQQRLHGLLDVLAQPVRLLADGGDLRHAVFEVFAQTGQRRVEATGSGTAASRRRWRGSTSRCR